ncbi:MAG: hypothetical protein Q8922_11680 [Bacteroidota bacterium]|nr:hypothetical protein [Bacteroidota bacterium]MDP4234658.1 hypothetical protein [Bacteroidota bacterium]MDP4243823.1 hypothetical protein [Bacteroidota bacterium]MDP4288586.1 hypothetical protein [Bacteroidota bacterium]
MKTRAFLLALLGLMFESGCKPYDFSMGSDHIVACKVLTQLSSVQQGHTYTTLHGGGAININYFGATQYLFTTDIRLVHGTGFRVLIRPDVEQRNVLDSGMILTVTEHGTTLDSAHNIVLERSDVRMAEGTQLPLSILSENNYSQVVLGCDTLTKGWSRRMESDDIVIQALPGSEVQVIQPDWSDVPDR